MSLAKMGMSDMSDNVENESTRITYLTRLMLILISALTKLAARDTDLSFKVILFLGKILSQGKKKNLFLNFFFNLNFFFFNFFFIFKQNFFFQ